MRTNRWLLACCVLALFSRADDGVKVTAGDADVKVDIAGKPFTVYHFAPEDKSTWVRPYFSPVLAADGTEVTSDQTKTNPKEHRHHRSIWVGQGDVNGVDHWTFEAKPAAPQQRHLKFESVDADGFVESLVWDDMKGAPLLNERRTARFVAYSDGSRAIDLTVALTAASEDVTLKDTKEAGLCSVRVAKQISDHPLLVNSVGATGEKAIWGKPADWADESGTIDGKPYGIAIFDMPTNPRHPTTWHAREYGLVAPNPFGLHAYDKKVPAGAGDLKIAKGETTAFRFRVVIHAGDSVAAKISEKYKGFTFTN